MIFLDLKTDNANEAEKYVIDISAHLSTISSLKEEIESISIELQKSNSRAKQLSCQLSSEAELREEMAVVLEENGNLRNDLHIEREQLKELIELQIGYEDELSEHWAEILRQVDGEDSSMSQIFNHQSFY